MADNIETIGGSTPDRTDVTTWEAATDNDLVTATTREIGTMRGVALANSTEIRSTAGYTDATYYRWLQAEAGGEFDHSTLLGARLTGTASPAYVIRFREDYCRIGGDYLATTSGAMGFTSSYASISDGVDTSAFVGYQATNLCVYGLASTSGSAMYAYNLTGTAVATPAMICRNCIAMDNSAGAAAAGDLYGFAGENGDTDRVELHNCAVINQDATNGAKNWGYIYALCTNCWGGSATSGGSTNNIFNANDGGSNYNAADDGTEPGAQSIAVTVNTTLVTGVTPGSEDLHIPSGSSDLVDAGTDTVSNEYDIDGPFTDTRDDIGPHELVAAAGSAPRQFMHLSKMRRITG